MPIKSEGSIGLVICYMGRLPWYFDYFLLSCRYNYTIDFYIITDDVIWTGSLPANVKVIYQTLDEINTLASAKLGFKVDIKFGYKLSDFKPAYGHIFSDLLSGYLFWGHLDLDVILGDIRGFITPSLLDEYDVISVRKEFLTGYFLLFRNTAHINNLFKASSDYKKVFSNVQYFNFDETGFAHDFMVHGMPFNEIHTEIQSMMHIIENKKATGEVQLYSDTHILEGVPGKLKWVSGKLLYQRRFEILLYHMIHFKHVALTGQIKRRSEKGFRISKTTIY